MSMRSDCFASRLTLAQREELFADIQGGMKLREAAEKVRQWSTPERTDPPTRPAISAWFRRMRAVMNAQEVGAAESGASRSGWGAGGGAGSLRGVRSSFAPAETTEDAARRAAEDAAGSAAEDDVRGASAADWEADEEIERGVRRAKLAWVRHGLEPQYVASFERNELTRRKLDLEERKHEFALRQSDLSRTLADMEDRLGGLEQQIAGMADTVRADAAAQKRSFDFQVGVNLMLITIQRIRRGPDWLPQKGPDGRYHQASPGQAPVPIETVERAVELTIAADRADAKAAQEAAAAAMQAANGGGEGKEVDDEKELRAAAAAEAPSAKFQAPGNEGNPDAAIAADQGAIGLKDQGTADEKAEGLKGGRAEINAERGARKAERAGGEAGVPKSKVDAPGNGPVPVAKPAGAAVNAPAVPAPQAAPTPTPQTVPSPAISPNLAILPRPTIGPGMWGA